jgi:hypothetical protein
MRQLPYPLGTAQVAQPVRSEVDEVAALWDPVGEEGSCGRRHQDLPGMADTLNLGAVLQRDPETRALGLELRPRVTSSLTLRRLIEGEPRNIPHPGISRTSPT